MKPRKSVGAKLTPGAPEMPPVLVDPTRDTHTAWALANPPFPELPDPRRPPDTWSARDVLFVLGFLVLFAGIFLGAFALDRSQQERMREASSNPNAPVNVCVAKGGIPSGANGWGDIDRCDFPPAVVRP